MKYEDLLKPRTTQVVQDASFLRRLFAFIIDILLLDLLVTAPFTPLFSSLIARANVTSITTLTYTHAEMTAIVLLFLVIYLYFVLFEYVLGQTLGMMLANTRLAGNDGLLACMVRNSFMIPVFPFIALWVIEPLAVLFWRRSVLEQLTKTRTVYQREVMM